MGVSAGPSLVTTNLIAVIDANNKKCTIWAAPKGFINTDAWANGQTGSVSVYGQNGSTDENARVLATDPWGDSSVVWETRANGSGDADGGWNTDWFNVDRTKLYRFSVWMRRTSSTAGGTFYFGLYGNGPTWGVERLDTKTNEGNPYWECAGTGTYAQNQWYLYVGHCYPAGTTYTGRHPDSGWYVPNGTKYSWGGCNIGNDVRMLSDTTQLLHRTYHYYCGDNTTRLQFAYPRIDLCDGTEPTIGDLLKGRAKTMTNLTVSEYPTLGPFYMEKQGANVGPSAQSIVPKVYTTDGTINTRMISSGMDFRFISYTIIGVARYTGGTSGRIISGLYNNWLMGHWNSTTHNYFAEGWVSNPGSQAFDTNWRVYAATYNSPSDSASLFVNGVRVVGPNSGASQGPNNFSIGASSGTSEFSNGEFACLYIYDRMLTDAEIRQMYFSLRSKFGL